MNLNLRVYKKTFGVEHLGQTLARFKAYDFSRSFRYRLSSCTFCCFSMRFL